jgi:hypothetical protein
MKNSDPPARAIALRRAEEKSAPIVHVSSHVRLDVGRNVISHVTENVTGSQRHT